MPAANHGVCMSTHFSSDEYPQVPESLKNNKTPQGLVQKLCMVWAPCQGHCDSSL